ncbi:restriction endonuclease [Halalkalibaculum sp. DA384]|uniref:nSTAND3 domain-containing NTPase n=1 Tax=Halalkalibaculum sp. DA384 TaxID=3373606 RepID=UPI003753FCAB
MSQYTFNSLNDKEFELLVRDLLQIDNDITLENFKAGRDEGIDLRYANSENGNLIIQCKHWLKSGLSKLKSHLRNKERPKVERLNPDRYLIATSLGLSPGDKKEIMEIFDPYILEPSDVIGNETLNNLLTKYPKVEEDHYKLWLSSTQIIKRISQEYIRERGDFYTDEIVNKVKLFVPTKDFEKAEKILQEQNLLMITGEPGIGKTMLADFLTFKYLTEGYELTYILKDLDDAEKVFDRNKKQIFYFDDFLGSNYLDILTEKNFDSQIHHLIKAIRRYYDHHMILTSRTTIYNAAKFKSEILDDKKFDVTNYQLELSSYSYKDRGRILYNHIYFSSLDDEYKNKIRENEFYLDIVKHENFNPRIIEFISDKKRIDITKPKDYCKFILESLNNPRTIWKTAFNNQISKLDRLFLLTLFSFDLPISEDKFKKAFNKRLEYESQKNGYDIPIDPYHKSVKVLLDGFIKRFHKHSYSGGTYLNFINPSVTDFLMYYLSQRKSECSKIILSAKFYEQIHTRFLSSKSPINNLFQLSELKPSILRIAYKHSNRPNSRDLNKLLNGRESKIAENTVKELIPKLAKANNVFDPEAISLFLNAYEIPKIQNEIDQNITFYCDYLSTQIHYIEDLYDLETFLKQTGLNSEEFIFKNSEQILHNIQDNIHDYIREVENDDLDFKNSPQHPVYFRDHMRDQVDEAVNKNIRSIKDELEFIGIDSHLIDYTVDDVKPDIFEFTQTILDKFSPNTESSYAPKSSQDNKSHFTESDKKFIKALFS